jgi:hypothetical protein
LQITQIKSPALHGAFVLPLSVAVLQCRSYGALRTLACRYSLGSLHFRRYMTSRCYKKSSHDPQAKPRI